MFALATLLTTGIRALLAPRHGYAANGFRSPRPLDNVPDYCTMLCQGNRMRQRHLISRSTLRRFRAQATNQWRNAVAPARSPQRRLDPQAGGKRAKHAFSPPLSRAARSPAASVKAD